jgi:Ca-activated chloride channel family protein
MANVTGGRYFAANSPEALAGVYDSIDKLEKSRVGRIQFAAYDELAVYFLGGALALLALELFLNASVWRRAA